MKCDGPSQIPCRGCRQANVKCVFEPRSRPKSISALPTRPPPFHPAPYRPMSPAGGGPPSFYPSGPSIAPPITSRPPQLGPNEPYALRQAREPVPPQPITSIAAAVSNPFPPRSPTTSTGAVAQPQPPPPAAAYYPPPAPVAVVQAASAYAAARPPTPSQDSRLRAMESSIRPLQSVPAQISALQSSITSLQRGQEALLHSLPRQYRAREVLPEVSEQIWESYRSRAWPLTPWLVGLRETQGLPGLVVSFLGRRTLMEKSETSRRECDEAASAVCAEIGRLMSDRAEWSREEIRALGVYA
jgi:hypothetical protein